MHKDLNYLIIVSGFGLGNSTRIKKFVLESLGTGIQEANIYVIASGRSHLYFQQPENRFNCKKFELILQKELSYDLHQNNLFYFLKLTFGSLLFIIKNGMQQKEVLSQVKFETVYVDSDYSSWLWFWKSKVPIVALNTAPIVMRFAPSRISTQYVFEFLELIYFWTIADLIICPVFSAKVNLRYRSITSWFCKDSGSSWKKTRNQVRTILVVLGGSENNTWDLLLDGFTQLYDHVEIRVIGHSRMKDSAAKNLGFLWGQKKWDQFLQADLLLIHAGFSSIMEAVSCGIPTLCLALENHHEQWVNTQLAKGSKNLHITSKTGAISDLRAIVDTYENTPF